MRKARKPSDDRMLLCVTLLSGWAIAQLAAGTVRGGDASLRAVAAFVECDSGGSFVQETLVDAEPEGSAPQGDSDAFEVSGSGLVLWHRNQPTALYTDCAVSAYAQKVFAGTGLIDQPRQLECLPLESDGTPEWVKTGGDFWQVDAAEDQNVVAAVMFTGGDSDSTVVHCWRPAISSVPQWSCNLSPNCYSSASQSSIVVSADGSAIALLITSGKIGAYTARLYYFDSASPTPRMFGITDAGARAVAISANGELVAVRAGTIVAVIDGPAGEYRWLYDVGYSTSPLGFSGDGRYLCYGFFSLRVREWNGSQYQQLWSRSHSGFFLGECAISRDGSTLAAGWNSLSFDQNRFETFSPTSSVPLMTYDYAHASGAYQDVVFAVAVSDDGSLIAVGSWGDQMNTNPEVHVFGRACEGPIMTVDAPGSITKVDIVHDQSGAAYAVACGKHIHFNQAGIGGDLFAIRVLTALDDCVCGDADCNETVNIADVTYLIGYIFYSGDPIEAPLSGDVDCNRIVNVSDIVYLIGFIFGSGPCPCAECP